MADLEQARPMLRMAHKDFNALMGSKGSEVRSNGVKGVRVKGVSITISFRISHLLFKIQNQIDPQLAHSDRALLSACLAFFVLVALRQPHT